jgi:hypothetical protein
MQPENDIFLFYEAEKQLFCRGKDGQFAKLTADLLDKEMQHSKIRTCLRIRCLSQDGLEHFVSRYGALCHVLFLDDCRYIHDLSPIGGLPQLHALCIDNYRGAALWDISKSTALEILSIRSSKKLIYDPLDLRTAPALKEIRLWGGELTVYPLKSLECFRSLRSLERIDLNLIRLEDSNLSVLSTLPNLSEFHFDTDLLTTEEIAFICARYPSLYGESLCAYIASWSIRNVRVCGKGKPSLYLPREQARLDQYVAQFHELVEKYRDKP